MKRLMIVLVLVPCVLQAQTAVDRLSAELEFLAKGVTNSWTYSTDFSQDPTAVDFDDTGWKALRLGEWLRIDSCWIRGEVVLPDRILGDPVRGAIRLLLTVDDYGSVWIDGSPRGQFVWDGDVELTPAATAAQKHLVVIKAFNTGGPLRLLSVSLRSEALRSRLALVEDLALSFRVGQKLLSHDTYQTNAARRFDPGIDRSHLEREEKSTLYALVQDLANRIDVEALKAGRWNEFQSSVQEVRAKLKPVGEFARRFTLVFNSNAHIDAAWLWRERETREVCTNTFSSVLTMMDARPDFTYTQSSAAFYRWMQETAPTIFQRIRKRVQDGRWEVVGGTWIEPDCNLLSGESWMRHLLYGKRYFRKELGVDVKLGWNPDSFGYNWNMPQFYREAGIDAFITQKIGWNDTNVFPHRVFWWEGPDGSRVLSYFPFDYVNEVTDPYRLVDWMRQFEANTGFREMLVLFGVGDHGGGPSDAMLDRVERLKTLDVYPTIEYATAGTYLNWLKQQDLSALPIWKDELYLEYHRGTFTTQAAMKAANRRGEALLTSSERFSTLAILRGQRYPSSELEDAWRILMFNQFHDILPGSSIREVYIDAAEKNREMLTIGSATLHRALATLSASVNTAAVSDGTPVVVYNPLAWERTDVVRVKLPEDERRYAVYDAGGSLLPFQEVRTGRYERELVFLATRVPSLGYSTFVLKPATGVYSQESSSLVIGNNRIENEFFTVEIDPQTGWVSSIRDKRSSREMLSGPGNRLQLLEDRPTAWEAWNIGLTGKEYPSTFRGVEVIEQGPVRCVLRVTHDYRKPGTQSTFPTESFPTSFFTQDIMLYAGVDRIDFSTSVDWWEEKTMLKVAFPFTVSDTSATYEIPYGHIRRTTLRRNSLDSAKFEVPSHRWADLSQKEYGVSLLNTSKYGHDVKGSTIRLTLLRSPKWPDPTADMGKHTIDYTLYPHKGGWKEAHTVRRGYELNNPLMGMVTDVHNGNSPMQHSYMELQPDHLVLTTVKRSEESDAWVIQWYDARGAEATARLRLPAAPRKAVLSNALEEDGTPLAVEGEWVVVPTRSNGIVTIKVYL